MRAIDLARTLALQRAVRGALSSNERNPDTKVAPAELVHTSWPGDAVEGMAACKPGHRSTRSEAGFLKSL